MTSEPLLLREHPAVISWFIDHSDEFDILIYPRFQWNWNYLLQLNLANINQAANGTRLRGPVVAADHCTSYSTGWSHVASINP